MRKIMIIEDDSTTRDELTLLLENEGFQIKAVTDFTDVAKQVGEFAPQLVLLDLELPGKDGFTLCMEIRRMSRVPILVLTSRDSVEAVAAESIERHRSLLIQNGVRIETCGLEHMVYTDGKWVCFMLGQLLQNAVRYRGEEPVITLSARPLGQLVQLTVSDNGIGILAQEVPRVFDRGFTGSNGRARGGSTGMGLYLCRKLANRLEIQLDMKSVEGQGASVTLTFPAKQ